MTRPERYRLKRLAAQAMNHLDKAAEDLAELFDEFKDTHEDEAEYLGAVGQNILMLRNMIDLFWTHAWGERQSELSSYRHSPATSQTDTPPTDA